MENKTFEPSNLTHQSIQTKSVDTQSVQTLFFIHEIKELFKEIESSKTKFHEPDPFSTRNFAVSNPFPNMQFLRKPIYPTHTPSESEIAFQRSFQAALSNSQQNISQIPNKDTSNASKDQELSQK